jgi:MFS family permease
MSFDPYAALRRPAYRRFLGGAFLSNLSDQALAVAAGWHLYERTGSAWALALIGLMNYLPIFLFSIPAGWVADHFPRKKVMAASLSLKATAALSLCALTALNGPEWAWFPLLFLGAMGRSFNTPAAVSFWPLTMPAEQVHNAVTWNSANFQFGAIVGPILGGLLLAAFGTTATLAFAAAGPLLYLTLLPGIQARLQAPPLAEAWKEKVLGGFKFVWRDKPMLGALSLDFVSVLFGGVEGIMPIFAKDILHCGPEGLGLLRAAPFAGALLMSLSLAHLPPLKRPGREMLWSVLAFGAFMLLFAYSRSLWLSLLALLATGMMDQISVYVRQTMVQLRTPEHLKGRVQAVNFLFIGSSNELGEVESGVSAAWLGPVGSVVLGGVAVLGTVGVWAWRFPELRELPRLKPHDD